MSDQLVALLNLRQQLSGIGSGGSGGSGTSSAEFVLLQSAVAQLDLLTPRIKVHPVQTATAGQTIFTLPEPYVTGQNRLLVYSGGVLVDTYTELSSTQIQFASAREAGEKIRVVELQLGSDTGTTVVDTLPSTSFLAGETPSGVINSTDGTTGNGTFTVANTVDASVPPRVFISGGLELTAAMFSRVGQVFTINAPYKPVVGESISIFYKRSP